MKEKVVYMRKVGNQSKSRNSNKEIFEYNFITAGIKKFNFIMYTVYDL